MRSGLVASVFVAARSPAVVAAAVRGGGHFARPGRCAPVRCIAGPVAAVHWEDLGS